MRSQSSLASSVSKAETMRLFFGRVSDGTPLGVGGPAGVIQSVPAVSKTEEVEEKEEREVGTSLLMAGCFSRLGSLLENRRLWSV